MTRPRVLDVIDCATLDARPPVDLVVRNCDPELVQPAPWAEHIYDLLRREGALSCPVMAISLGQRVRTPELRAWCDRQVHAGHLRLERRGRAGDNRDNRYELTTTTTRGKRPEWRIGT
jgi:hypothetical protein